MFNYQKVDFSLIEDEITANLRWDKLVDKKWQKNSNMVKGCLNWDKMKENRRRPYGHG